MHAIGSLATLVIVAFLTSTVLFFLLLGGERGRCASGGLLSVLVISPILFLGAALLYFDQAARVRKGGTMPTYIMLSNLTAQGVQTLKANPDRLREVNRDVEELGAKVVHQWATLGPFDFVNVVEAPDAETMARVSVALGARGSAKLQTLTALTIDEFLSSRPAERRPPSRGRRGAALATISSRFTSSVRPPLLLVQVASTNGVTPCR